MVITVDQIDNSQQVGHEKLLEIKKNSKGKIRYVFAVDRITFVILVAILCIIIGTVFGVLRFGVDRITEMGSKVVKESEKYQTLNSEYKQLEHEYKELELELEKLNDEIIVLGDTISQNQEREVARENEKAQAAIPIGFPVEGIAEPTDVPEVETEIEPAMYLEAAEDTVVVATGIGVVERIQKDVYDNTVVYVEHGNGYKSIYVNTAEALIKEGTIVNKGTPIFCISDKNTLVKYQITLNEALIDPSTIIDIQG